jgi:c-di-GMP-binding flagellar brake protein YcgR
VKAAKGRKDQRKHTRRSAELSISVSTVDGPKVAGQLQFSSGDLSEGGAFLKSDLLLEEGEIVNVDITLPGGQGIKATARVVRTSQDQNSGGMGIQFVRLAESDRKSLLLSLMTLSATGS